MADKQISLSIPDGWLLDNSGESIRNFDLAPTDIFALLAGLAAASLDLLGNHQNFTFNNLIACLICCDILQVPTSNCMCFSGNLSCFESYSVYTVSFSLKPGLLDWGMN